MRPFAVMDDPTFAAQQPVSFRNHFAKSIGLWLAFEVWGALSPVLVAAREHQSASAFYQPADVCFIFGAFLTVRAAEYFARLSWRSKWKKTLAALAATSLIGTFGAFLGTLFKTSTWFLPHDRWLYTGIYALIATLVIAAVSADAAREDVLDEKARRLTARADRENTGNASSPDHS